MPIAYPRPLSLLRCPPRSTDLSILSRSLARPRKAEQGGSNDRREESYILGYHRIRPSEGFRQTCTLQAESTASQSPGRPAVRDGDSATTRQIARRFGHCKARNSANARQLVRRSVSQLLSSIKAVRGDCGFWLKLPRTSLAWLSQLRRGRSGKPGGKEWDLGRRAECA
ncbi:unnamed protein product [Sphagnum balticum]